MPTSDITSIKDVLLLCFSIPIHRHADHSIAVSEGVRKEISRIARLTSDDISVVYNPIVTDRLKESAAEPPDHPWFDEEVTTLVSTGRHVEQKGFDVLVRAFAIVREQVDEDIRLLIFGDGPDTEQYRDIAEECGIAEFVAFPGFVNNIFSEMAAADIFVLSSRWEGFGNVVVEAMACGTQIVSTDCQSGPAEILANGKYGTLTEVDNPQPLAEGILSHLKQSHKYSVEERAEKFTTSEIARKYAEIFEAVSSI
ncbi:group 1 glycosyl transferase [Haloferax larsenii JCM 13917]|nr:group 1 glycosyl transferase [Haloferax larsenii JCM 13917]